MRRLTWDAADLTHDAFLSGLVHVWQPRTGYRAGVDAVLLAASVPARAGQCVLELGCGAGTAALCLSARVADLQITGVELQADYAALAGRNAAENNAPVTVINADLRTLPADLRQQQFDHVMMNPPYFVRDNGTTSIDAGRDTALAGPTPLADWLDVGIRRLAPKGHLTLIQRIERLPDVLSGLQGRLGSIVVRPVIARSSRAPHLFLLRAIHGGKAPFRIAPPLIMHLGDSHDGDRESYTPDVQAVLRNGAALTIDC